MASRTFSIAISVSILAMLASAARFFFPFSSGPQGEVLDYYGFGRGARESIRWDPQGRRFLLTDMSNGITQLPFNSTQDEYVLQDPGLSKYSSLGLCLDEQRHRLLVVFSDLVRKDYGALASYDTRSWRRIFLTQLYGPDTKGLGDDVAVDEQGTAYVTDAEKNIIHRVDADGVQLAAIESLVFTAQGNQLPFNLVGLNGIVYHPQGFLLVSHTWAGTIFKVALDGNLVQLVRADTRLWGDGLALVTPGKLAVAGVSGVHLLDSNDGWETAVRTRTSRGPFYRYGSSVTVREGRVYTSFLLGLGWNMKRFCLREADFSAE